MKVQTAIIILTTLKQIGELSCMKSNLATVVFWSAPLSRMTVYRYLQKLEVMDYVKIERETFRGYDETAIYKITQKGIEYLERIKDGRRKRNLD